ncbi:MAG: FAD-dependent oxidoreductase, partial [Alphaproteobacteria bacterium]|nr:FAD-dependent oxidoreductase [Alphaproteobacteria bacterium]
MANLKNVVIIGSGPAGYTAAIYAARADLKPILISGIQPGGQLTITTDVENYPGYENPIQGPWLMEQMQKQSLLVGTEIINNHVEKVELHGDIKKIYLDNGETISSKSVIICTGAQARWLNIENEKKLQGRGLSACATCDGFFFKDKVVAVIGGGNTAAEEALFLSKFATKVLVIHRRDKLRAEKILQERLSNNKKIDFFWNSEVKRYYGDSELTA